MNTGIPPQVKAKSKKVSCKVKKLFKSFQWWRRGDRLYRAERIFTIIIIDEMA